MTLKGIMTVSLRYFSEVGSFGANYVKLSAKITCWQYMTYSDIFRDCWERQHWRNVSLIDSENLTCAAILATAKFLLFQEALIKSVYANFTNFGIWVVCLMSMQNEV